jgi:hypothetical protein
MKRFATLFTLGLLAFSLSAQAPPRSEGGFGHRFGMMSMGPGSRTPVTGAPYSAIQTTESHQILADGNQIARQDQAKVYRDSQGRVRTERLGSGAQASAVIAIFDPVAAFSYVLRPAAMTAVKSPVPVPGSMQNGGAQHSKWNETANVQTEDLGTQVINGFQATGTRTTRTLPAGAIGNQQAMQIVREAWVSIDLKVPLLIKSSDPRFGSTVMQLTNIVRTEPDASLFQVPAGYTVTAGPSRMNRPGPRQ